MKKANWNRISNWLFYLGIIVGALGYYRIYKIKASLPPGICPVNNNRGMLFAGVFLLMASVIIAYVNDRKTKKAT